MTEDRPVQADTFFFTSNSGRMGLGGSVGVRALLPAAGQVVASRWDLALILGPSLSF